MTTRMLIDARHPEETRVAVVAGARIEEFDFEAANRKQLKGNIYLAKVTRVEPSLQAAFVDYGGNRHGFLAFSEIHPDYYQIPLQDREALLREEHQAIASMDEGNGHDGDEAEDDVTHVGEHDDMQADALRRQRMDLRRRYKIQEVIKRRQILLVQVVKEERGGKGAALTTYLSLAGRYSVLMPNTTHGGGISRKISSVADRRRLKTIMAELKLPRTMGCIIRTAGLKRTKAEIRRDFDYLTRLWDEIRDLTLHSVAPTLVYEDSSLIKRAIRDIYNRDIEEILVEGEAGYRAAKDFMRLLMPSHARKVQLYRDATPLFARHQVEAQLNAMYSPVVQLRSGGYIVINPTEALVSIDINSGRATREHDIEETAVKTNVEAAQEIARQLRLRDMAGLVVIDFIDMEEKNNIRLVERKLKDALKLDRARIQVGRISSFGLMEMSRQRLRTGVLEASTQICPHCDGAGFIRTLSSSALHVLRGIEDESASGRASIISVKVAPEVAIYLLNQKRRELSLMEAAYGVFLTIEPTQDMLLPRYEIARSGPPPIPNPAFLPPPPVEDDADDPAVDEIDEEEADYEADADQAEEDGDELSERDDGDERPARPPVSARDEDQGGDRRRKRRRRRRSARDGMDTAASDASHAPPADAEDAVEGEDGLSLAQADARIEQEERAQRRRRRRRRGGRREGADARVAMVSPEAAAMAGAVEGAPQDGAEALAALADIAPVDGAVAAELDSVQPPVSAAKAEELAKPVRKRASRRKAEPKEDKQVAADAAQVDATSAEGETATQEATAAKPKRKTAVRKKKTQAEALDGADAPVSIQLDAAPAPDAAPALGPPARDGASLADAVSPGDGDGAAIVVPAAHIDEPVVEATPPQPPRKGWWQRTFG